MTYYSGDERRKFSRINANFVVSYRILEEIDNYDISQTKNICIGGMLLTTNVPFEPGTRLNLEIRVPFNSNKDPINIVGRVIESKVITNNLIYDTRLEFLTIDNPSKEAVEKTVEYFSKRKK